MRRKHLFITELLILAVALSTLAQTGSPRRREYHRPLGFGNRAKEEITPPRNEYTFARLIYSGGEYGPNNWTTDSPKADVAFAAGVKRLTNIDVREDPFYLPLTSKAIFQYPFLYAVEVGHMELLQEEANILREYLLRGGFFVVDDFHGTFEWANFEKQIRKALPDCKIEEVPVSHPIFHCFFDINELFQIPGAQFLYSGHTYEKDGYVPHFRGIFDDSGRLMVMINFNSDLGDAWEWSDVPYYPEKYTSAAYRLGINYIIYSMTH